jgi:hypothetical protein
MDRWNLKLCQSNHSPHRFEVQTSISVVAQFDSMRICRRVLAMRLHFLFRGCRLNFKFQSKSWEPRLDVSFLNELYGSSTSNFHDWDLESYWYDAIHSKQSMDHALIKWETEWSFSYSLGSKGFEAKSFCKYWLDQL